MSHSAEQAGRHSRSFAGSGAADWFFSEMQTRHEVDFEEENKRRGTMGRSWATSRSGLHFATLAPRGALGDSSSTSSLLFLLSLSLCLYVFLLISLFPSVSFSFIQHSNICLLLTLFLMKWALPALCFFFSLKPCKQRDELFSERMPGFILVPATRNC